MSSNDNEKESKKEDSSLNSDFTKKGEYQIAISQDGKFAVTFDTGKYFF